jgi:uncharacterized membrane protein HdeD (DUF308 family)
MKMNESLADRIIRGVVGIILIALGLFGAVNGAWMYIVYVLGAILLVTGIVGICPLYRVFKFSTVKNK